MIKSRMRYKRTASGKPDCSAYDQEAEAVRELSRIPFYHKCRNSGKSFTGIKGLRHHDNRCCSEKCFLYAGLLD